MSEDKRAELLASVKTYTQDKPHLQFFLTPSTLSRYLRARSMDVKKASKMLLDTLMWREKESMHTVTWETVDRYAKKGKIMRTLVRTKEGRPVLHMRPRYEENVNDSEFNLKHFMYQMEMATRHADEVSPDGKMVWIVDYTDYSKCPRPPMKTSVGTLHILQNHHPERLHESIMWHAPGMFSILWNVLYPFIDLETRKKVVFLSKGSASNTALQSRMDVSKLDKVLGGTVEDTYDYQMTKSMMQQEEREYAAALKEFVATSDGLHSAADEKMSEAAGSPVVVSGSIATN